MHSKSDTETRDIEQSKKLHDQNPLYGTSGGQYVDDVIHWVETLKTQDVLDYGCGKNKLAEQLPFQIQKYDPAITIYAPWPRPADIVTCTDVMEHIDQKDIERTVEKLWMVTKKILITAIDLAPAKKSLPDGRNTHLSVLPISSWVKYFEPYFSLLQARCQCESATFKPTKFIGHWIRCHV